MAHSQARPQLVRYQTAPAAIPSAAQSLPLPVISGRTTFNITNYVYISNYPGNNTEKTQQQTCAHLLELAKPPTNIHYFIDLTDPNEEGLQSNYSSLIDSWLKTCYPDRKMGHVRFTIYSRGGGGVPSLADRDRIFQMLEKCRKENTPCVMHDNGTMTRVYTVAGSYLVWARINSAEQILAWIEKHGVRLTEGQKQFVKQTRPR